MQNTLFNTLVLNIMYVVAAPNVYSNGSEYQHF